MPNGLDKNYLQQVASSEEVEPSGRDFFFGFNEIDKPSVTLRSSDISLTNWVEGKCEDVQKKISSARGLFAQFKSIAAELVEILSEDSIDEKSEYRIGVLQKEMEELRKQILTAYPEIFDSWEIVVTTKWKFPKTKIFVDENVGPLFSLLAVTTPHIQWRSGGLVQKTPQNIAYTTKFPNVLVLSVKSVPAEFCASPFQIQAFGSVVGKSRNVVNVQLVTQRAVQFH